MTSGQVLPWPSAPPEHRCHSTGGVVPSKKCEDPSICGVFMAFYCGFDLLEHLNI